MTVLRPVATYPYIYAWTAAKTAAYTAVANDAVPCNTTGGTFAVAAPTSPTINQRFRVKWISGSVAPTVTGVDSTFTGFGIVGDSADFAYDGTTWQLV
jgi:hypothetical protein